MNVLGDHLRMRLVVEIEFVVEIKCKRPMCHVAHKTILTINSMFSKSIIYQHISNMKFYKNQKS